MHYSKPLKIVCVHCRMPPKKWFKLHEVLAMLEDDPEFTEATMYITPPADPNCSDEDSGDEDQGTANNFTRRQLEAETEVTIRKGDMRVRIGIGDDNEDDSSECSVELETENASPNIASTTEGTVRATPSTSNEMPQPVLENNTAPPAASPSSDTKARRPQRKTSESIVATKKRPSTISKEEVPTAGAKSTVAAKRPKVDKPIRKWVKADLPQVCKIPDDTSNNRYSETDSTPASLFEWFIDNDVVQLLVDNTNKYAVHKCRHDFLTTDSELRLFLSILFTSGYAPLPRRRTYWEPSDDVRNLAISGAMTRNRFEELMCNIHVADNDSLPAGDRMAKVRPLFVELNQRFIQHFPKQKNLAVDESMVPYFGRHSAKQYIRGKPIHFG